MVKHAKSEFDGFAVLPKKKNDGFAMALQRVVSACRKAFIGALKCMYFLNHLEIPHTTNFVLLLELGNSMQELLQCLGETVVEPISSHVPQSPFFSLVHRRNNRRFSNQGAYSILSLYC